MDLLQKYYNENFSYINPFSEVTESEKKELIGTFGFQFFKLDNAVQNLKNKIKNSLNLN